MAKFEDRFLGWLVLSHDKLKEAIGKLPPQMRTYQAIHEATGIGPQQLSEYVSGKRLPSLINLKRLCLYLGISADELLGIEKIEDEPKD